MTTIEMLAKVGHEIYCSCLAGGAHWSQKERFNRMQEVRPGDLVMELSTAPWYMRSPHGPRGSLPLENGIGILDRIDREPYPREKDDPPWDEKAEGKPEPLEQVFYLKRLNDGSEVRWTNARFVTILPVEGWKSLSA